jgi:hypothetical protein
MLEGKKGYLTRKEGVKHVREVLNIPLTVGRVNKDAIAGIGPEVAGQYGRAKLYTCEAFEEYALRRAGITKTAA